MNLSNMGIIGCGTHAQHHINHYGNHFITCGVWDPNLDAMKKMNARGFDSLEQLLAYPVIRAVMICSPDEYHLTQIEMALAAGKHVFCEKPLLVPGEDMARLEAAFDLAAKKQLVLTSCHPRRCDHPFEWLLGKLHPAQNESDISLSFGKVVSLDFDFSYHEPANPWKRIRSLLLDHVNHEVDLMNYLFGIKGFEAWKLMDGFDHYEVAGKREDGITFHFRGTRRLKKQVYPEWCRVRFERGDIALDLMMGLAHLSDHDKKTVETVSNLMIDYEGRLKKVMADFYSCQNLRHYSGYLSRVEMLMNTEAGIILQEEGVQRINVRS